MAPRRADYTHFLSLDRNNPVRLNGEFYKLNFESISKKESVKQDSQSDTESSIAMTALLGSPTRVLMGVLSTS